MYIPRVLPNLFLGECELGVMKFTTVGDQICCKSIVILNDLPSKSALFELVSYSEPLIKA